MVYRITLIVLVIGKAQFRRAMLSCDSSCFSTVLDQILFILACNDDIHKSLDECRIWPDLTTDHRVSCPSASKILMLPLFSSPEPLGSQGELIVYQWIRRPSYVVRPSLVHNAQTSSRKPLGRSKPNFMWSLLGKGE